MQIYKQLRHHTSCSCPIADHADAKTLTSSSRLYASLAHCPCCVIVCLKQLCLQVGYKCMRPRTNRRSAFTTKCMVLAAYLTVNMGIGGMIAITTTWFWWVYMMMGILLFLLGVRIIIFGLSLVALIQSSRRHRRQRKLKRSRAAAVAAEAAQNAVRSSSGSGVNLLQPQQQQLQAISNSQHGCGGSQLYERQQQGGWSAFAAVQRGMQHMQSVLQQHAGVLQQQTACLQPQWCQHSSN